MIQCLLKWAGKGAPDNGTFSDNTHNNKCQKQCVYVFVIVYFDFDTSLFIDYFKSYVFCQIQMTSVKFK